MIVAPTAAVLLFPLRQSTSLLCLCLPPLLPSGDYPPGSECGPRLDTTLLAERLTERVERVALAGAPGRQEVLPLLALAHLLLHGDHLLLLSPAQREGDADQQGRHGDGPQGAAGEEEDALEHALGRRVLAVEPGAGRRRDDVAEGEEAVGQGLGSWVEVGVVGDFGVCGRGVERYIMWLVKLSIRI